MPVEVFDPNAVRILRTAVANNDDVLIYQVPVGYNFYLEEVSLSVAIGQAPTDDYSYVMWERGLDGYYMRDLCQIWYWAEEKNGRVVDGASVGDHAIFPSCLKLAETDQIRLVGGDGYNAEGNISGFLVSDYA